VVYAEDDPANQRLMRRVFTSSFPAAELVIAESGRSVLNLLKARTVDLLLLDLNLPDMPRHDLLPAVHALLACSGVPMIILSGEPPPSGWTNQHNLHYLTKPFVIEDLVRTIIAMTHDHP
jgi:CheY-like chemotaxis protein